MTDDYSAGYDAGTSNQGVWGGESQQWLEGFNDATEDRIEREITASQREEAKPTEPERGAGNLTFSTVTKDTKTIVDRNSAG